MRITLIHPPDGMLPTVPYASMPALTACLKAAGHEVRVRDVNLELIPLLLRRDRLEAWHDLVAQAARPLHDKPVLDAREAATLWRLQRLLAIPSAIFAEVEDALAVMKDRARFLDPDTFSRAFDVLRSAQRFAMGVGPQCFTEPHRTAADVLAIRPADLPDPPVDAFAGIVDDILAEGPELVGVTLPYDSSIFYGLKLMRLIRDRAPDLPIVIGGAGIDSFAYPVTKDPAYFEVFDWAMVGEGEEQFPRLADAVARGEDPTGGAAARRSAAGGAAGGSVVNNLCFLKPDGTVGRTELVMVADLNAAPAPDFGNLALHDYLLPDPVATFQTSRGCYYGKCTFCSEIFRKNFRMRRPDLVVEDMVAIHAATGITHFQLWDSLAPPKTLRRVAQAVIDRGLDFEWMAETKFEKPYLDEATIATLARGGCTFLLFGFESGSSRVLDLIDKGNDLHDVDRILEHMRVHGIRAGTSWFIGFPGESEQDADTTFDFIATRRDRILFSNYTRTFDIGTDTIVYADQERFGIEVFGTEAGGLDYRYRDGTGHWDRHERDEAFHVRGDFHQVKNHIELHYAKVPVETALRVTGQGRMGPLLRHVDPDHLHEATFEATRECVVTAFPRHPHRPLGDAAGAAGAASPDGFAVAFHMITGHAFELDPAACAVLEHLQRPASLRTLAGRLGLPETQTLARLEMAINRGLVRIQCDESHLRYRPDAALAAATSA